MLNLKTQSCLGMALTEVVDRKMFDLLARQKNDELQHWEMVSVNDSGVEQSLHLTKVNIKEEGQTTGGLMLLVQDLSQIRELEEQLQRAERDAVVGRMAAGVAHELRNPLSSVKGLALLLKSKFGEDLSSQQTADLMVEQVERLNRSISELLDYARPGMVTKTTLHIDELLAKAVMLIRTDAETQNILVEENYGCGATLMEGDQDKLTQLFLNLCLNGIQAIGEGGKLSISTDCSAGDIIIEIADNGCGISPEVLDKVFEPYFTTKHGGTGLGLAMSARIIHDHNGSISLTSVENEGTTITIKLPAH
jgi:two-component system sensor histidine kinase HydH